MNQIKLENIENCEAGPLNNEYGIKKFANKTKYIGQIAAFTSVQHHKYEPLPYFDYRDFEEKYNIERLNININLHEDNKHVFMPGVPITVQVKATRKPRYHLFNQFNYKIELTHGKFKWEINRDFSDIKEVHKALTKIVERNLGRPCSDFANTEIKEDWPVFPCERDHRIIGENKLEERCKKIAEYLERVLVYPPFRDTKVIFDFLCVSPMSFVKDLGQSLIEDYLHKHTYKNMYYGNFKGLKKFCHQHVNIMNKKRWFCVKDTYITYLNQLNQNSLGFVMLIDRKFKCKKIHRAGAYNAIEIRNLQRSIVLRFKTSDQQRKWYDKIKLMIQTSGKPFICQELLINGSFAPKRINQKCKWYVNAAQYMEHVMLAINNAKEEIFITDWWLCPELFLKRPTYNLNHRLDKLLLKKAKENVKIYLLIYKEVNMVLELLSERVKAILSENGENRNIKVLLHPKNIPPNVTRWTHHEKMVIVDQSVAFFGGIDLCYGRWDDDEHRLIDIHDNVNKLDVSKYTLIPTSTINFEPKDGPVNLDTALRAIITNSAVTCNLASNTTKNTTENFEETLLSFNKLNIEKSESESDEEESKREKIRNKFRKLRNRIKEFENEKFHSNDESNRKKLWSSDESELSDNDITTDPNLEVCYWIGKDYANTYKEDFKDIKNYSKDQFDRKEVPRMPWRDEALVVFGESARDLARHFIQRWNQSKIEIEENNHAYPYLLPKSYPEQFEYDCSWFQDDLYKCSVQMLRSLDTWSGGLSHTERSILNAYCDLINKAEHYVYIENQYFVTTANSRDDKFVENNIGACLADRIIRAHNEGKNFRVFVVIPLLPGFDNMNAILAVQYYNLRSIKYGEFSIFSRLKEYGITDPSKYITFHSMRNWSVLMGKLVQEIIYVHSKLMIVDDKYVICGSANINDRSMLGSRDSEVAGLIEDEEFIDSILDNQNVKVGKYAHSLRIKIFKLHLGIYFKNPNRIDVKDCVCDEFYNNFKLVSHKNTIIYDDIFKCIPSDNITNTEDLKNYSNRTCLNKTDPVKANDIIEKELMGLIVDFPLNFLSDEKNFFPSITTLEGIAPINTWT